MKKTKLNFESEQENPNDLCRIPTTKIKFSYGFLRVFQQGKTKTVVFLTQKMVENPGGRRWFRSCWLRQEPALAPMVPRGAPSDFVGSVPVTSG